MVDVSENIMYGVNDRPPLSKLALLGLQHVMLMSVYLILVVIVIRACHLSPDIENNAVRMGMIVLGIAAAIQALRPPFGSGYLAVPVVSAIYLKVSLLAADEGGLPLVLGMTIFAGVLEILISRLLQRLRVLFPPGISGFIICIVGIELGLEGLAQFLAISKVGTPDFNKHLIVGGITLATMIGLSIWWHGIARLICSFLGLAIGLIAAFFLGIITPEKLTHIVNAKYIALPYFSYISYQFSFKQAYIIPFFVASIAAALRTIGVITTCQKINTPNWKRPEMMSIKAGVLADGLGCTLAGLLGVPGISTAPSLVGVSKASGATSRYIAFAAGIILFLCAFSPKIASLFLIMPMSVVGPALMFTGSFMIVGGLEVMTSRNIDTRTTYVIGFAFLFGLSKDLFSSYYNSLPGVLKSISSTSLSLSVIVALILNLIFRLGIGKKAIIHFENEKDVSDSKLQEFILQRAKTWKIDSEMSERIIANVIGVMQNLRQANLVQGNIRIMLHYDEVDFLVKISYIGDLLVMPFISQNKKVLLEEEAFSYGLVDFFTNVRPDRYQCQVVNDEVNLYLYFAI